MFDKCQESLVHQISDNKVLRHFTFPVLVITLTWLSGVYDDGGVDVVVLLVCTRCGSSNLIDKNLVIEREREMVCSYIKHGRMHKKSHQFWS